MLELLTTLPDDEASQLLGRLRAGAEIKDLVEQVRGGSLLVEFSKATLKEARNDSVTQ